MSNTLDTEQAVRTRYSAAAEDREPRLCCAVDYDQRYLEVIPQEVIDRDYGCGDPSKYLCSGESVLDLGSGGGKICFIAAQVVGPTGRVIGVDMNDTMLQLARKSQPLVSAKLGYDNVEFRKGKIQDLAVDRDAVDDHLRKHPVTDEIGLQGLEAFITDLRRNRPLIPDDSVDAVVSNCVLNLVDSSQKRQLFEEIYRVLRPGGRAIISDIVSDEPVPQHLQDDPELWSGCISGALQERAFVDAFERAGFYGVQVAALQDSPWQTVEGIEFRSATVIAYKGNEGPCYEHNEAVIYRGPFRKVIDDDGHVYNRGERTAVCRKTFSSLNREPYADHFIPVHPREEVSPDEAQRFDCSGTSIRSPRVTKGVDYKATIAGDDCCSSDSCC